MVYLIREQGRLRIETGLHLFGLFSLDLWRQPLWNLQESTYGQDGNSYTVFACMKPVH
ncbi:MAG: hypothetical protein HYV27_04255 [Candidatus Hydrogenedentes bacterium]|nr:hypothetical protein [Candidatus Hydrogenedentota bacterium]